MLTKRTTVGPKRRRVRSIVAAIATLSLFVGLVPLHAFAEIDAQPDEPAALEAVEGAGAEEGEPAVLGAVEGAGAEEGEPTALAVAGDADAQKDEPAALGAAGDVGAQPDEPAVLGAADADGTQADEADADDPAEAENAYFGVWMCDADHTPNTGGSVTINYINPGGDPIPSTTWTSSTNQTVPAGLLVTLTANPAEGYHFKGWYEANINKADAGDPHYLEGNLISAAKSYTFSDNPVGEGAAPYICAVFEEGAEREAVAFQVWVGNEAGNESAETPSGGTVAWEYYPSEPNTLDLPESDGTDYAAGRADCGCYLGDEVTVYAEPDEGYHFVGWYAADGEWPKNGNNKYTGEMLSSSMAYTFKPDYQNRLICAVFAEGAPHHADQVQMWTGSVGGNTTMAASGGKVSVSYTPSWDDYASIEAKDGADFSSGQILAYYVGDACTVTAQADEGHRFVGWYRVNIDYNMSGVDTDYNGASPNKAYQGEAFSTAASYTYKPGETMLSGDTEPLRYVCAVFEEAGTETCTVSFAPGTGTGSMASASVEAGSTYELPECGFTHDNAKRAFYKWRVGDELMDPGDTITVDEDTTVTALWMYTRPVMIDNSVDQSTTQVHGAYSLTDTRTGDWFYELVTEETTSSAFTEPSNPTVQALIDEAKEEARQAAESKADGSPVTVLSEEVSDPSIVRTIDNRTYTYFDDAVDAAGDYYSYLIVDGTWAHEWRYTVRITAEYASPAPHTHTLVHTDAVDPTCTEDGMAEYWTCSECGKAFADESGTTEVTDTSTLAIPATGHSWDGGTVTKEPTCTEAGERLFTCQNDATHIKPETVPAPGHDWGDWTVVEEATEEEDGLRERSCSRCDEVEQEVIPKLVVEYFVNEGDGSSWQKGGAEGLTFVFKRTVNDETTFGHLTGVLVDGAEVEAASYDAVAGSAVVTLHADYLETLPTGSHTLTAQFEDGNDPTASFTVQAEGIEEPAKEPDSPTPATPSTPKAGTLPQTSDPFAGMAGFLGFLVGCGIVLVITGMRMRLATDRRSRR